MIIFPYYIFLTILSCLLTSSFLPTTPPLIFTSCAYGHSSCVFVTMAISYFDSYNFAVFFPTLWSYSLLYPLSWCPLGLGAGGIDAIFRAENSAVPSSQHPVLHWEFLLCWLPTVKWVEAFISASCLDIVPSAYKTLVSCHMALIDSLPLDIWFTPG